MSREYENPEHTGMIYLNDDCTGEDIQEQPEYIKSFSSFLPYQCIEVKKKGENGEKSFFFISAPLVCMF